MNFASHYKKLNAEQKTAVDTIFGPILVVAGPGSGKTELLAVRIANILRKTDAHPSNILCITYTDNAKKNMQQRLFRLIGNDAYKVAVHTFHTFGIEIIKKYAPQFQDTTTMDEITGAQILEELTEKLPWDNIWKQPYYLSNARDAISKFKSSGITPDDLHAILEINGQLLNHICPFTTDYAKKIFSLGRKKEDAIKKVELWKEYVAKFYQVTQEIPSHHLLYETLVATMTKSLQQWEHAITSESDTKPITQWKNEWLEKTTDGFICKESSRHTTALDFLELYTNYLSLCKSRKIIDYDDMILQATMLVEQDINIQLSLSEQYQWILIDEFQDTNDAQLRLVTSSFRKIVDSPNILAVGDDDQSIFKFQGANIRNIRIFTEVYPDVHVVILQKNYRSSAEIIDFSRSIMDAYPSLLYDIFPDIRKKFIAQSSDPGHVSLNAFENDAYELIETANAIKALIDTGTPPKDIAIISKKNNTLERIAKLLLHQGIPVYLSKQENIFENESIILLQDILLYVDSLQDPFDRNDLLIKILSHPMWKINRLTLWNISRQIYKAKKPENKVWIEVLRHHPDTDISKIAQFFMELSLLSKTLPITEYMERVTGATFTSLSDDYLYDDAAVGQSSLEIDDTCVFQSPFYAYYCSEDAIENDAPASIRNISHITSLLRSFMGFYHDKPLLYAKDMIEYIALIKKYNVAITPTIVTSTENAVQCVTIYKAKGLEYKYVYGIALTKQEYLFGRSNGMIFPTNFSIYPQKEDTLDMIRNIYTLCTRAKTHLTLSYSKNGFEKNTNNVPLPIQLKCTDIVPQMSENEYPQLKWTDIVSQLPISDIHKFLQIDIKPLFPLLLQNEEESFLKSVIQSNFSLSATSLMNFLDIVYGGPEKFLTTQILQFPTMANNNAIYGTSMHSALENFFQYWKQTNTWNSQLLLDTFRTEMQAHFYDQTNITTFMDRGIAQLTDLIPILTERDYGKLELEYSFYEQGGIMLSTTENIEDIPDNIPKYIALHGKIDRMEVTDENKLIVVDYKTSKGTINTKNDYNDWRYQTQMVFYALMLSISPRWSHYSQQKFQIFFLEKNKKTGKFAQITKYIQVGEIERMKQLIRAVMRCIYTLDFPDTSQYTKSIAGIRQFEEDLLNNN